MKAVLFVNFSGELFAHPSMGGKDAMCRWDGEPYSFPAGSRTRMQDYKAKHFAKHLVNRELGNSGDAKKVSQMSPKVMEDAPFFMELFTKAYVEIGSEEVSEAKVMDEVLEDANPEEEVTHPVKTITAQNPVKKTK